MKWALIENRGLRRYELSSNGQLVGYVEKFPCGQFLARDLSVPGWPDYYAMQAFATLREAKRYLEAAQRGAA